MADTVRGRQGGGVRAFECRQCGNVLYFENTTCVSCGSALGFSREEKAIVPVDDDGRYMDAEGDTWWLCRNRELSACTWLTQAKGSLCFNCALTRTRPADSDAAGMKAFPAAESAKRRLIVELDALELPIVTRAQDPENGLAFDLLSSANVPVTTGHQNGVVTIDLAEGDSVHRERLRRDLDEPYRTLLGHFRHETGHYYEALLVRDELLDRARELFGDERQDYGEALDRHYAEGPPAGWRARYISAYATMHPWEDFAETFAHFLHIADTIDTAQSLGLTTVDPSAFRSFRDLVAGVWIPLSVALNQINRSMGKEPLYPFVIAAPVLEKLEFVASLSPRYQVA
nr:putative zinc-binding metallopeptidase [Aeromicrobium senzhongii]